jgi:hypothetical protein
MACLIPDVAPEVALGKEKKKIQNTDSVYTTGME